LVEYILVQILLSNNFIICTKLSFVFRSKEQKLINSMEQSPSSEANRHSASQDIPHFSWNVKVHYHLHKNLPLDPVLSQMNPVQILKSYILWSILILSSYLCLGHSSGLFPSDFPIKILHACLKIQILSVMKNKYYAFTCSMQLGIQW